MKIRRGLFFMLTIVLVALGFGFGVSGSSAQLDLDDPPGSGVPEGHPEIQSEIMAPAAGGTGIYTSNGLEFLPFVPSVTYAHSGVGIFNTSASPANFETQLHLPHGVTIQKVVIYFYDNNDAANLSADFNYHSYSVSGTNTFAEVNSSGASAVTRYVEAVPSSPYTYVDSTLREYTVEVLLPPSGSVILYAVRVDYSYTSSLPLIVK